MGKLVESLLHAVTTAGPRQELFSLSFSLGVGHIVKQAQVVAHQCFVIFLYKIFIKMLFFFK